MTEAPGESKKPKGARSERRVPVVRSLERAAQIGGALFLAPEGKTLAALSQELRIHKTTVWRLLRALVELGVVEKDLQTEVYRWHPVRWLTLACGVSGLLSAVQGVQSVLDEVAEQIGLAVNLAVPDTRRNEMVVIGWSRLPSPAYLRPAERIFVPMHATAAGRAYLASLPEEYIEKTFPEQLPRVTEHTVASRQRLLDELAIVRERGYAVCREEFISGTAAVAVAVNDAQGAVAAALAAWGLAALVKESEISRWVQMLRRGAERLAMLLPGGLHPEKPSGTFTLPGQTAPGPGRV